MFAKATIVGNLCKDPEYKSVGETSLAICSVAVNQRVRRGGDWEDGPTMFFKVEVWGRAADRFVDRLEKGNKVLLHGDMGYDEWEHQGKNYSQFKIKCSDFEVIPKGVANMETETVAKEVPW